MNDLSSGRGGDDLLKRLEQLNHVGVALSQEKDITKLLEAILVAAKDVTHADGGTLYRMTEGRTRRYCAVPPSPSTCVPGEHRRPAGWSS